MLAPPAAPTHSTRGGAVMYIAGIIQIR